GFVRGALIDSGLGNVIVAHELLAALELQPRIHFRGLGLGQIGLLLLDCRLVGRLLDAKEEVALLDLLSFGESALLDEAGNARDNVHLVDGGDGSDEAAGINDLVAHHGGNRHGRRRRCRLRIRCGGYEDGQRHRNRHARTRCRHPSLLCSRPKPGHDGRSCVEPIGRFFLDAHFLVLRAPRSMWVAAGAISRLADAYLRCTPLLAAGPAAKAYSGSSIGRPVVRSTRMGSTALPVLLLTSKTLGPSGAKCLLPQASNAMRIGRKSRARSVGRYSSRGGCSLYRRRSSRPASTNALSRRASVFGAMPRF